jgi:hypothetical protein
MTQRIDLATKKKPVREFIESLGRIREPVELVLRGSIVAKIVAPTELSEAEKRRILEDGWVIVEKARARTKHIPPATIQKAVNKAIREVRSRHAQRRR